MIRGRGAEGGHEYGGVGRKEFIDGASRPVTVKDAFRSCPRNELGYVTFFIIRAWSKQARGCQGHVWHCISNGVIREDLYWKRTEIPMVGLSSLHSRVY